MFNIGLEERMIDAQAINEHAVPWNRLPSDLRHVAHHVTHSIIIHLYL